MSNLWSVIFVPKAKKKLNDNGSIQLVLPKDMKLPLDTGEAVLKMKSIDEPFITIFCGNTLTVQFEKYEPVKMEVGSSIRVPIGTDEETLALVKTMTANLFETITTELDVAMAKRIKTLEARKKASGSLKNYYLATN